MANHIFFPKFPIPKIRKHVAKQRILVLQRLKQEKCFINGNVSEMAVMLKSVRPKDLTDKISYGLTRNSYF